MKVCIGDNCGEFAVDTIWRMSTISIGFRLIYNTVLKWLMAADTRLTCAVRTEFQANRFVRWAPSIGHAKNVGVSNDSCSDEKKHIPRKLP